MILSLVGSEVDLNYFWLIRQPSRQTVIWLPNSKFYLLTPKWKFSGSATAPAHWKIFDDISDPDVAGDNLVRIDAFGANRMGLMQQEGTYSMKLEHGDILDVEFSWIAEAEELNGKKRRRDGVQSRLISLLASGTFMVGQGV